MKKVSLVVVLSLIVSLFASVSAMAAEKVVLTTKGGTVSISNVVEKKGSTYNPIYVVEGSTTLTLNSNTPVVGGFHILYDMGMTGYSYYPDAYLDGENLENGEISEWIELSGGTVTLNKKGIYRFDIGLAERIDDEYEGIGDYFGGNESFTISISEHVVKEVPAKPTTSKIIVNGEETAFEAYNINDNNFFKLRDLATVVSGTEKQFEVSWDAEYNIIRLNSGQEYEAVGGELAVSNNPSSKTAKPTSSMIIVDGEEVQLTAYNIGGNNYFKLRDIASIFNIGVTWDGAAKTVGIDTQIDYKE